MSEIPLERLASEGGTETADRVADIMVLFSRTDSPLGVSGIARALGISKAVVYRILRSLSSRGLLQFVPDSSTYILGPTAIGLGNNAWAQSDFRSIAAPVLSTLRDKTRETATLSVLSSHSRIYLDQYESPQQIKMTVELGVSYPLHSGSSSRAILAFLPPAYVDEAMAQGVASVDGFDEERQREKLEETRTKGFAVSLDERKIGAASIAAPFFNVSGHPLGSVSACGPIFRFDENNVKSQAEFVLSAARELTQLLAR
ncbi:IclR family transcriptional regulator [Brevibacterium linens]|uniref:IclR family transcriptional regulator n=1 Tax=Brevibacterium linens TaxID=1703 RepID=UPI003BF5927C